MVHGSAPLPPLLRKNLTRQKTWSEPSTAKQGSPLDKHSENHDHGNKSTTATGVSFSHLPSQGVAPVMSVAKIISQLLHVPSNRCCADCRSALVDSSQVHASFRPLHLNGTNLVIRQLTRSDEAQSRLFSYAHRAFAPAESSWHSSRNMGNNLNSDGDATNDNNGANDSTWSSSSNGITALNGNTHHGAKSRSTEDLATINPHHTLPRSAGSSFDNLQLHMPNEPPDGGFLTKSTNKEHSLQSSSSPDQSFTLHPSFQKLAIDPAILAYRYVPGHGVFLCAQCAHAHRCLGDKITVVRHVQEYHTWKPEEAAAMKQAGGNTMAWKIYEAYLPETWRRRRPNHESQLSDRLTFCRAKYEAMGFVLPPIIGNRGVNEAWQRLLQHNDWAKQNKATAREMNNLIALTFANRNHALDNHIGNNGKGRNDMNDSCTPLPELPQRLIDFFCVVGSSGFLDPRLMQREGLDLSTLAGPEGLDLEPRVIDCYPRPKHYADMDFPEHVAMFVLPEGCRPSGSQKSPGFFTFVLTTASGHRLYGASLQLYDEAIETQELQEIIEKSGYKGAYPTWLPKPQSATFPDGGRSVDSSRNSSDYMDIVYLPKCLVVLSHYPFFDLFRKFLLQLYRITLVEAPLPIERFVANFCCEVPLPPPGKVEVKFGFTVQDIWSIQRPPENKLPLTCFSYKPVFACLSVGNIITVLGCLMEESRVALCSRHYALLGPIAEALLSFLFPFQWQGMYIPVMPYGMLDILDAPVPFLVGVHARYLIEAKPHMRPQGVVFVDVDRDIVHLGYDEDSNKPRMVPALPEKGALKLRAKLEEHGSSLYVAPDNAKLEGSTITTGHGIIISDAKREAYATTFYSPLVTGAIKESSSLPDTEAYGRSERRPTARRRTVMRAIDKAYQENELLTPITGFLSEQGQLYDRAPAQQVKVQKIGMGYIFKPLRRLRSQTSLPEEDASGHFNATTQNQAHSQQHGSLLDLEEVSYVLHARSKVGELLPIAIFRSLYNSSAPWLQ
jgi:DENN (AEX-3) domain/uDENN domain/Putative GTPase activating protein for Arf